MGGFPFPTSPPPQVPPGSLPLQECLEEELRHPDGRTDTDGEAEDLLVVVAEGVRDAEF